MSHPTSMDASSYSGMSTSPKTAQVEQMKQLTNTESRLQKVCPHVPKYERQHPGGERGHQSGVLPGVVEQLAAEHGAGHVHVQRGHVQRHVALQIRLSMLGLGIRV